MTTPYMVLAYMRQTVKLLLTSLRLPALCLPSMVLRAIQLACFAFQHLRAQGSVPQQPDRGIGTTGMQEVPLFAKIHYRIIATVI